MTDLLTLPREPSILTVVGLVIAVAFLGSKLFQRLGIPQVVGFIVFGMLLGTSFFNLLPLALCNDLSQVSDVALGLIGFDMGGHLRFGELSRLGRSIAFILLFEAFGTFLLVSGGLYALTGSLHTALIFGALSSATAPAATVDVLAEYDAGGPLTTTLLAVVGLDDALSLLLYSVIASAAVTSLSGTVMPSVLQIVELPFFEIGGAFALGTAAGLLLNAIMGRMRHRHDSMAVSIGFVFICAGLAADLGISLILTTMVMGMTVVNRSPQHGRYIRFTIEQAGPVIYVLFFALVGARFDIHLLPTMGLLGIAYVLLRSGGKYVGAWLGGLVGAAPVQVRDNLGLGLLSQAGVAIGLALDASKRFTPLGEDGEALGTLIISVITATTFIVQIFGPIGVKFAISRAGEVGGAKIIEAGWASEGAPD